jgi:hypothetical protein
MQKLRRFKGFLFLILFLPVLVMGENYCTNSSPVKINIEKLKIRNSTEKPEIDENQVVESSFNGTIYVFEQIEG